MDVFQALPGAKGLNVWAPAAGDRPAWAESLNAGTPRFIASAFKPFVLAAYLLQVEESLDPAAPLSRRQQLDARLGEELTLDEEVFSPSSPVFNPPELRGQITARTVVEAMIGRSDNTATDIALRLVGPDRVRRLIAGLGLANTRIPDSTRQMFGWVYGDPDWRTITWQRLVALGETDPYPHRPLLNDVVTMASTPNDLVAFYGRAFRGDLFRYPETLDAFQACLALADTTPLAMPLGVNAFAKGGWAGAKPNGPPAEGAVSLAGAVFARSRWVFFAAVLNWPASAGALPAIEAEFFAATTAMFAWVRDHLG
jgi:beta-lactamase class A